MFTKLILISIALIVACNAYSLENKQSSTTNDPVVESIKFLITRLRDFEIPQETNKHSVTSTISGNIVKNENASPTIEKFPPLSNSIEAKIENPPSNSGSLFHENESKVVSPNSEIVPVSSVAVGNKNVPSNTISSSDTIDKDNQFPLIDATGEKLQISFSDGKIAFSPGIIKINPDNTTTEPVENVENMTETSSTTSENATFSQTFEENQPPSLVDLNEDLPLPDPLLADPVDDTVAPTGPGEGIDINQTPVSQETLQLIMETINSLQEQNLEVESVLNEIAIANEEAKTNTPSATELQAMVASNKQMLEKLLQLLNSLTFSEDGHSFSSPQIEVLRTNLLGLESNSNGFMSEFSKVKDVLYVVATELNILKGQSEGLNALVQEASQGYNAIENVMVELSSTRGIMEEILQGIRDARLQRK